MQQIGTFELIRSWLEVNKEHLDLYIYPEIEHLIKKTGYKYQVLYNFNELGSLPLAQYDFLLCGTLSYRSNEHCEFVQQAKKNNLMAYLIVDNWSYIAERFIYPAHADGVFVIDNIMAEMVQKHSQIPTIEIGLKTYKQYSPVSDLVRILFITEPYHSRTAETEDEDLKSYEVFLEFIKYLEASKIIFDAKIRPHPRDTEPRLNKMLGLAHNQKINLKLDNSPKDSSLENVDLVLGLSSMYLVESSLCGVKTISIQTNSNMTTATTANRYNIRIAQKVEDIVHLYNSVQEVWPGQRIKTGQSESILSNTLFK